MSTPTAETLGKDAVIEVHQGNADGPVLKTHAVMVRVRKEIGRLTTFERAELVKALHDLHVNRKGVTSRFVLMHRLATGRGQGPDQAHKGSAFIAWHRAFLLLFERELQKTYPHVSLPYWVQGPKIDVFTPAFLGQTDSASGDVDFDPLNSLYGWSMSIPKDPEPAEGPTPMGLLQRSARDHGAAESGFRTWQQFQSRDAFAAFIPELIGGRFVSGNLEFNPHDFGHGFVGPPGRWMSNCRESNADPVFWAFHCYDDYLWARWQHLHGRFGTDGSDPKNYAPADKYQTGSRDALGHHLFDTRWPWVLTVGEQVPGDFFRRRPPQNGFGKFPKSPLPFLWPNADASPTPADPLDYLGLVNGKNDLGFCYDDVPFGANLSIRLTATELVGAREEEEAVRQLALHTLLDRDASPEVRLLAARQLSARGAAPAVGEIEQLMNDTTSPHALRQQAIQLLFAIDPTRATNAGLALVRDPKRAPALAAQAAERLAHLLHFSSLSANDLERIHAGFAAAAESETRPEVLAIERATWRPTERRRRGTGWPSSCANRHPLRCRSPKLLGCSGITRSSGQFSAAF